jgi:hypothetical protein
MLLDEFLGLLATDPAMYQRYRDDPEALMREKGLSEEDQIALKSRHVKAMTERIRGAQAFAIPVEAVMNGGHVQFRGRDTPSPHRLPRP